VTEVLVVVLDSLVPVFVAEDSLSTDVVDGRLVESAIPEVDISTSRLICTI